MRDELWTKSVKKAKDSGAVLQVWTDKNPQGFSYRQFGTRERELADFEGVALVKIRRPSAEKREPGKNADTT